jgi:hypothetical protein
MASSDVATSTISNNPARRRVTTDFCPWPLRCGSCMTSGWHGATKTAGEHLHQRLFQASPPRPHCSELLKRSWMLANRVGSLRRTRRKPVCGLTLTSV